jgi:hypothetical protein
MWTLAFARVTNETKYRTREGPGIPYRAMRVRP